MNLFEFLNVRIMLIHDYPNLRFYLVVTVCGPTKCDVTTTKSGCTTVTASCVSWAYAGTYTFWQIDTSTNRPMYYKQVPAQLGGNWFMTLYFVPEINRWTVSSLYFNLI